MLRYSGFLSLVLAALLVVAPTASAVEVYVNQNPLVCQPAPFIVNGTTLVPLRAIFEALGAQVGWDGETRTVTAFKNDRAIVLSIGSRTGYVNNQSVALAEPAMIEEGRTFVPLRFVSESLGAEVKWVPETKQVIVTSQDFCPSCQDEPREDNPTAVVISPEEIRFN